MSNGPLSPDSADFMALLKRHLASEAAQAQHQATDEAQMFGGDRFGEMGRQYGGGSSSGPGTDHNDWFGQFTKTLRGQGGQQQQGYNNGQRGIQTTLGINLSLSPEFELGTSGASSGSYNFFSQGQGQRPFQQSSGSSFSSLGGGASSGDRRGASSDPTVDAEPAQLQMALMITEMLKNGTFDVNAVKALSDQVQSQTAPTRSPPDIKPTPLPRSASINNFRGIPAVNPTAFPASNANTVTEEQMRALIGQGTMSEQAAALRMSPAISRSADRLGSAQHFATLEPMQREMQRQQRGNLPSGTGRQNPAQSMTSNAAQDLTTLSRMEQFNAVNSSYTNAASMNSGQVPRPASSEQYSAVNTNGGNNNAAMLQQLQSQGGGIPLALMSNPAFLQALRAISSGMTNSQTAMPNFGVSGNWPQPGIETPEGSTGKPGTDSGGSQGGSPPSDSQAQTNSARPETQDQTTFGQDLGGSRPKVSLPGKKVSRDVHPEHRQSSNSSRGHSHSASPEAELHAKRKADLVEPSGHTSHKHKGALSEEPEEHEDDSEDEEIKNVGQSKRKGAGNSNRRKSLNAAALPNANEANLDPAEKAYRRKQQNRAAQKAFRERREQRVKDLEDKLADMEAKAAGRDQENENLRQLLGKLQKENMNLQSSAFTFSGPLGGNGSSFEDVGRDAMHDIEKLPSPPLSTTDSRGHSLRNPKDAVPPLNRQTSSLGSDSTPASNNDASGSSQNEDSPVSNLELQSGSGFHPDPYNAFAAGAKANGKAGAFGSQSGFMSVSGVTVNRQPVPTQETNINSILAQLQSESIPSQAGMSPFAMSLENRDFTSFREVSFDAFGDVDFSDTTMDSSQNPFEDDAAMKDFLRSLGADSGQMEDASDYKVPSPIPPAGLPPTDNGSHAALESGGISVGSELFGSYFRGFGPKVLSPQFSNKGKSPQGFSPADYPITSPEGTGPAPLEPSTEAAAMDVGVADGQLDPLLTISTFGMDNSTEEMLSCKVLMQDGSYMSAGDVWQKIQAKLNFSNGFDLDDLCDQMKSKAICTVRSNGTTDVIKEEHIDDFVRDYEPVAVKDQAGNYIGGWEMKAGREVRPIGPETSPS